MININVSLSFILTYSLTVTANCPMELEYFPMDRQKCTIEIESCKSIFVQTFAAHLSVKNVLILLMNN